MQFDVTLEILGLDGKTQEQDGKPITLRSACCHVLLVGFNDELNLSGEDKLRRWKLALRIHGESPVELTAKEVTEIMGLVAKAYNPGVVGPVWLLLDPESNTGKPTSCSSP